MRVYIVSSEVTVSPDYVDTPECSDVTTNVKVFQKLSDAISFVKNYDYLANDCSIESPEVFIEEPDFWTAEDGLLVLSVTSNWPMKGGEIKRYTLYIEEMELE